MTNSPNYGTVDWALGYARDYRQENRAADALRTLSVSIIELRTEVRVLRELLVEFRQATEKTP